MWPPTGIAVAALLLGGYRLWPGVFLGAFISNATSHEPLLTAAGIAVGNTLGPLLGVFLLRRLAGFDNRLERVRDVLSLVALGSVLAMTVTATNGVLNLALARIVPWEDYWSVWRLWWVGDAMGVLLIAPLILTWGTSWRHTDMRPRRLLELVVLGAGLLIAAGFLFTKNLPFDYPLYPFVIWAALRFQQRATTLAVVAIAAFMVWGTVHGFGSYTNGSLDHRLMLLVTSMAVLAVTGLVLSAATTERRQVSVQLQAAELRFRMLAEVVPQMVWTADASGWIDWYNHRWYEYTGQTPEQSAGWGWQGAHHPDDFQRVIKDWPRSIGTGEPFNIESRILRRDGSFRWFLMRAEPLRDKSGSIIRWYGTHTDIDEQKRAQQHSERIAERLQAAFLPGRLPVRADLRFDALYLPAESEELIGGDWYDAFELPDGRIVVSIGDVVGHGAGAAATASRIRHGIFALAYDTADPAQILEKINSILLHQETALATALIAVIRTDLAGMTYASAGHPPPIVASSLVTAQSLPFGGLPLGVSKTLGLANTTVRLERDAVMLFYTDGVTEFRREIEHAEARLHDAATQLVSEATTGGPAATVQRAVMGSERPRDDAVIIVAQLAPARELAAVDDAQLRKSWTFHSSDAQFAHTFRHELMTFIRRFAASNDDLFRIELIIGEILANTVEHAPGLVEVEIDWRGIHPVLAITDTGPGLLRFLPRLPEDNLAEGGRGLFLIKTLAGNVRVQATPNHGTRMTMVLSVSRDGTLASNA